MIDQTLVDRARSVSCLSIAERAGAQLRRVGTHYEGPCPACGGEDRFQIIMRNSKVENRWLCRQCTATDKKGASYKDAIALYMLINKCSFTDAVSALTGETFATAQVITHAHAPAALHPPSETWQATARKFHTYALQNINAGMAWLTGPRRHLTVEAVRRWGIGYNPTQIFDRNVARWGLDPEEHKAVWLPRGWVIPTIIGDQLWAMKIRRHDEDLKPTDKRKTPYVTGSTAGALFGADDVRDHTIVIFCEGEWDVMLAQQLAGDMAGWCTLGAQGYTLDVLTWGKYLHAAHHILIAYDTDGKSEKGADKLAALTARAKRITVPSKDITDYVRAGGDLRAWLTSELRRLNIAPDVPAWARDALAPYAVQIEPCGEKLIAITDPNAQLATALETLSDDEESLARYYTAAIRNGLPCYTGPNGEDVGAEGWREQLMSLSIYQ